MKAIRLVFGLLMFVGLFASVSMPQAQRMFCIGTWERWQSKQPYVSAREGSENPARHNQHSIGKRTEQTLKRINEALIQAYPRHDTAVLDRVLADDLIVTNPDGTVGGKSQEIAGLKSGKLKLESVTNTDVKVRVYGGVSAVVTGLVTISGQVDGREISSQNRYTTVFARRRGGWLVIALQVTQVR